MNDISLNRRFVETDDEKEARLLFDQIFKKYRKTVFDTINRRRRNHPDTVVDSDAITNDAFLKAFNKRKQIGKPEKLVGWLIRAAENLMIDEIRKLSQKRRLSVDPVGTLFDVEKTQPFATSLAEADAEQAEAQREQVAQILRLLEGPDRQIVIFTRDELSQKEMAQDMDTTPGAVEKKWKRLKVWVIPVMLNLEALINCLPKAKDRKIMQRYFGRQPLSEITEALGISGATVKKTVKRVIGQWEKAAKNNPTDPVSEMVKMVKKEK